MVAEGADSTSVQSTFCLGGGWDVGLWRGGKEKGAVFVKKEFWGLQNRMHTGTKLSECISLNRRENKGGKYEDIELRTPPL